MAEEIAQEVVIELTNAINNLSDAVQNSNYTVDSYWIALIPAIAVMIGIFVTIFQFNHTQVQK